MHFKFLIFRNWKGSTDSGENIWRSPYSRKLEGHQVWKDGHVGESGNRKFPFSYTCTSTYPSDLPPGSFFCMYVVCMWFTYCITYIISIMYCIDKAADFLYSVLHGSVKIGLIIKIGYNWYAI